MANERTFLAWIRTNIGIIAFGFVIERFGLFIKRMDLFLGKGTIQNPLLAHGHSEIVGMLIVGFGTIMSLLAYLNFKNAEKQIVQRTATYVPSGKIYFLLIVAIITIGIFLIVYLSKI